MSARHKINSNRRPISWLLILSVFMLTVFPAHLHLHHEDNPLLSDQVSYLNESARNDTVGHEHEIDLHLLSDNSGEDHHEQAHVIKASPEVLTRSLGDNASPLLLFFLPLFIFPVLNRRTGPRPRGRKAFSWRPQYHLVPPSRAPPGR